VISPQIKFKKKWLDNKGVSEIIGTILMLAITVVLFSSIMVFVTNMPTPTAKPTVDFLSHLTVSTDPLVPSSLTLTHNGGEPLNDYDTTILLVIDGSPKSFFPTGIFSDAKWSIGRTWTFSGFHPYPGFKLNTTLEAMIIDTKSNSQVWNSRISAGAGNYAPVILQRWADGDASTLTVDPIVPSDTHGFRINVRITDINGLSDTIPVGVGNGALYTGAIGIPTEGVWLDVSSIPASLTNPMPRTSYSGGIWSFDFPKFTDVATYDGRPIFIHAKDHSNLETVASFIFTVEQPDITNENTNNIYEGTNPTGYTGLPDWLKYFNGGQGWILLPEAKDINGVLTGQPDYNNPRLNCVFIHGDKIWLLIGSLYLSNINNKNEITLIGRATGITQSGSSLNPIFQCSPSPQSGNAYIYQANLISTQLDPGAYDMKVSLMSVVSQGSQPDQFTETIPLFLNPTTGTIFMPTIVVYDSQARTALLGTSANPMDLSVSTKVQAWIEISVLDSPKTTPPADKPTQVSVTDINIADMNGRTNQYGDTPSSFTDPYTVNSAGISQVFADSSKNVYYFMIDLRLRNGEAWSKGLASYSLTVGQLFDANEGVYTISTPLWIKAPLNVKNFIAATDGFGWKIGGGQTSHLDYLFQIDNNKFFTGRVLDGVDEVSGMGTSLSMQKVLYFDIDGDGDRDALCAVIMGTYYKLTVYINRMNEYGIWEPRTVLPQYTDDSIITAMAAGDVDGDGNIDWIVANELGNVLLYRNVFPITKVTVFSANSLFNEMRLADVNGDGKADLIAMGSPSITPPIKTADRTAALIGGITSRITVYNLQSTLSGGAPSLIWQSSETKMCDFDVANIDGVNGLDIAATSSASGVVWYTNSQTINYAYTSQDDPDVNHRTLYQTSGTWANLGQATSPPGPAPPDSILAGDTNTEVLTESGGTLLFRWKVTSATNFGANPMLRIAATTTATADSFNFYYSTEATNPTQWTFLYSLTPGKSLPDVRLKPGTIGPIWVEVRDSAPGDTNTPQDAVTVNTIGVYWTASVGYSAKNTISALTTYTVISIGNADSLGYLDIVIGGKIGGAMLFTYSGGWSAGVTIGAGASATSRISPTLDTFVFTDVNGDGKADLITVEMESTDTYIAILYEWLNLGGNSWMKVEVKNLYDSYGTGGTPNIKAIAVEDMYG